jgi:hypothetical protein
LIQLLFLIGMKSGAIRQKKYKANLDEEELVLFKERDRKYQQRSRAEKTEIRKFEKVTIIKKKNNPNKAHLIAENDQLR